LVALNQNILTAWIIAIVCIYLSFTVFEVKIGDDGGSGRREG
jgi:hypothetical protein